MDSNSNFISIIFITFYLKIDVRSEMKYDFKTSMIDYFKDYYVLAILRNNKK